LAWRKAGQKCLFELWNKKWGFVIIWAFVQGIPRLRQALFVACYAKNKTTMKTLTTFILILFPILTIFGQNGLKEGNLFLLLKNSKIISVNYFNEDKIQELKSFEITKKSIYTTDQKTRVAILDTAKNNVTIFDTETINEIKLTIPYDLKPKTILLNNDNLFIGGEMGKEMLVQYNINSKKWYQLDIPTQATFPRKAIDDLVVNDSLLIAIDNLIMPKYILFYRLNANNRLDFSHFKDLKSNGAYESIYKGRITSTYLGLISGTYSGYTGAGGHITVYKNIDLIESFAVSSGQEEKDYHTFNDFLIIGNKLIIASREKGLGILEIEPSYFKGADEYGNNEFNADVSAKKVKYKEYKNKNIKSLTVIPNTTIIILTIEDKKGKIRHEIIKT
jgi:hypothetical protein